jgi:hypothetical protein
MGAHDVGAYTGSQSLKDLLSRGQILEKLAAPSFYSDSELLPPSATMINASLRPSVLPNLRI